MQSHHGLHGIGNNNTNSHQAQFGRLRFPIFSDSIQLTSIYVQLFNTRDSQLTTTERLVVGQFPVTAAGSDGRRNPCLEFTRLSCARPIWRRPRGGQSQPQHRKRPMAFLHSVLHNPGRIWTLHQKRWRSRTPDYL